MAACSNCSPCKTIPTCVDSLLIGSITSLSTDVTVYFKDITTQKIYTFEETTDGSGNITVDLGTLNPINATHTFEVWATLKGAASIHDNETLTVGSTETDCILFTGEYVVSVSDSPYSYMTISVELQD